MAHKLGLKPLNLRDSGAKVLIGLRTDSKSIKLAKDGFEDILTIEDVCIKSDLLSILIPDKRYLKFHKFNS